MFRRHSSFTRFPTWIRRDSLPDEDNTLGWDDVPISLNRYVSSHRTHNAWPIELTWNSSIGQHVLAMLLLLEDAIRVFKSRMHSRTLLALVSLERIVAIAEVMTSSWSRRSRMPKWCWLWFDKDMGFSFLDIAVVSKAYNCRSLAESKCRKGHLSRGTYAVEHLYPTHISLIASLVPASCTLVPFSAWSHYLAGWNLATKL
jgi:hypothetical protein